MAGASEAFLAVTHLPFSEDDVQGKSPAPGEKQVRNALETPPRITASSPCVSPASSPRSFLLSKSIGPYTCLRVEEGRYVVDLEFNLSRLRQSAEGFFGLSSKGSGPYPTELSRILGATGSFIARTLKFHRTIGLEGRGCEDSSFMVTLLLELDQEESLLRLWCHTCPLPQVSLSGVKVEVRGQGRACPVWKLSSWIHERQPLEAAKSPESSEVILSRQEPDSPSVVLLEGLVSNIFLVSKDDKLYTSPDGVLEGQGRDLVLAACKQNGIQVYLEAPCLHSSGQWKEAFLTSVVRIAQPVTHIKFRALEGDDNTWTELSLPFSSNPASLTSKIRKLALTEARQRRLDLYPLEI